MRTKKGDIQMSVGVIEITTNEYVALLNTKFRYEEIIRRFQEEADLKRDSDWNWCVEFRANEISRIIGVPINEKEQKKED